MDWEVSTEEAGMQKCSSSGVHTPALIYSASSFRTRTRSRRGRHVISNEMAAERGCGWKSGTPLLFIDPRWFPSGCRSVRNVHVDSPSDTLGARVIRGTSSRIHYQSENDDSVCSNRDICCSRTNLLPKLLKIARVLYSCMRGYSREEKLNGMSATCEEWNL